MHYDFRHMISNGKMARDLGVDPRTLRDWAKSGHIPSYVNPANNYRYYMRSEVLSALGLARDYLRTVDAGDNQE